jgi:hypothetical protein
MTSREWLIYGAVAWFALGACVVAAWCTVKWSVQRGNRRSVVAEAERIVQREYMRSAL